MASTERSGSGRTRGARCGRVASWPCGTAGRAMHAPMALGDRAAIDARRAVQGAGCAVRVRLGTARSVCWAAGGIRAGGTGDERRTAWRCPAPAHAGRRPCACPGAGMIGSEPWDPRLRCAADETNDGGTCSLVFGMGACMRPARPDDVNVDPCGLLYPTFITYFEPTPDVSRGASALSELPRQWPRHAFRPVSEVFSEGCARRWSDAGVAPGTPSRDAGRGRLPERPDGPAIRPAGSRAAPAAAGSCPRREGSL